MKVKLPYGKGEIEVEVPDKNFVEEVTMPDIPPLADPVAEIARSLECPIGTPPLSELARGKTSASVVVFDITRPVPNKLILPPILKTLEESGISRGNILLIIATGLHRPNVGEELISMVGKEIYENYRIVNHDARNLAEHEFLGYTSNGAPIEVDKRFLEAELHILTGSIEPHFMAGFTGGRKGICPGISSVNTIKVAHSPQVLEHPKATNGVLEGNPFHEMAMEVARRARVDFLCNVVLDKRRRVIGVFSGDLEKAYLEGVELSRRATEVICKREVDIVITTNGGYPLDINLYQAVKGMVGALPLVKEGGTIIIASECSEGLGSKEFAQQLKETTDLEAFVRKLFEPGHFVIDQWEVEELAKAKRKAEIYVYCKGISDEEFPHHLLKRISSVEEGIELALQKHGKDAAISVIPDGPYVMPVLR